MRTAMMVARLGTVRAASAVLGVHRATVTRHIDALEYELGSKLFLRHRAGYTPTSEGNELRRLAESAERLVNDFFEGSSERQDELTGTVVLSSLASNAQFLMPAIQAFCLQNPMVKVQYRAECELPQLELGEAHIAMHSGLPPTHPDYVVVPYCKIDLGLYGHRKYLSKYGVPFEPAELIEHQFVGLQSSTGGIDVVNLLGVPPENLKFVTNDPLIAVDALEAGIGLGVASANDLANSQDVIEVFPRPKALQSSVWLVTHVDLHRTRLVQAILSHLKATAPRLS